MLLNQPDVEESHGASESLYTPVMSRAVGVVRGYGSLLRVVLPKASPPYLIHRFYAKPLGSALDSLKKDWESVSSEMWMVSKREIENAEAAPSVPAPSEPRQPHGQVIAAARSESVKRSSGPIPDPETLAQYDKVHPGLAKTIVTAFEAEYQKRHRLEVLALEADIDGGRIFYRPEA